MFDFDVVTGPSSAERAAAERARTGHPTAPAALAEGGRPAAPAGNRTPESKPSTPA